MAPLRNTKHERFAQELAEGKSTSEAYEAAGYKPDRAMECAPNGGQFAGWELTGAAGLSEDESHGQAPYP